MKLLCQKYGTWIAAFALVITSLTANSTCVFAIHQPVMPEAAKKLRKF